MRQLRNLNYIELYLNEFEEILGDIEHIEISGFDIANSHPSGNLYLLFLDLSGFEVKNGFKIDFSLSIDLFTDRVEDLNVKELLDLKEIEEFIQKEFYIKNSSLRELIENHIDILIANQNIEINLGGK